MSDDSHDPNWSDNKLAALMIGTSYTESEYMMEEPTFQFQSHGEEIFRVEPDGRVFFQGREIGEDKKIFEALQYWALLSLPVHIAEPGNVLSRKRLLEIAKSPPYVFGKDEKAMAKEILRHRYGEQTDPV